MGADKSDKELAFIQDLFIAADWGERFAILIDGHVKLPNEGRVLYAGAGTGSHALALFEKADGKVQFVCVDENEESVALARAKAVTLKASVDFRTSKLDAVDLEDDGFDGVLGDLSLISHERIPAIIAELVRVARPEAQVAFVLVTASSFGEFFSIYWEALHNSDFADSEVNVERLITALPAVFDLEKIATLEGLRNIQSWTQIEEFQYASGEDFLNAPLVADFLMKGWLQSIPDNLQSRVAQEISQLINEERHNAEFSLTVKATLLVGKKGQVPLVG